MSALAVQPSCADLDQQDECTGAISAPEDDAGVRREAERLAELAASFCLFGLEFAALSAADWSESAERAYRAERQSADAPANDVADAAAAASFPALSPRRLRLAAAAPMRWLRAFDWLVLLAAAELAALWGAGASLGQLPIGQAGSFVLAAAGIKAGLWMTESYRTPLARMRPDFSLGGLALGAVAGLGIANLIAPDARAAAALAATLPLAALLLAGAHAALALWLRAAHRAGAFAETIVVIGATPAADRLARRAARSGEARIVAIADDRAAPARKRGDVAGTVEQMLAWDGLPHVDRIVIAVTQRADARVRSLAERLGALPNRVDLMLDIDTHCVRGPRAHRFAGGAMACVSGRPHDARRALAKRIFDLTLGSLLLALFAPAMLTIAAAVKLDSKGPVLYRQARHGFNNRIITVLKFRSMRHEPGAPLRQVRAGDERVTRLGRFLRVTSLDELPQLINVVRGDMSLVGPRPHAVGMRAAERELQHIVAEYAHRHRVKPGITGWAQINGSRGPIESAAAVRERLKLDLEYVARASLWLDLQILLRTVPALLGDREAVR